MFPDIPSSIDSTLHLKAEKGSRVRNSFAENESKPSLRDNSSVR